MVSIFWVCMGERTASLETNSEPKVSEQLIEIGLL